MSTVLKLIELMHQSLIDEIQCGLIGILSPNISFDPCPDQLYWLQITVIGWSEEHSVASFFCYLVYLNLDIGMQTVKLISFDHLT
jgi:hypothetical protein